VRPDLAACAVDLDVVLTIVAIGLAALDATCLVGEPRRLRRPSAIFRSVHKPGDLPPRRAAPARRSTRPPGIPPGCAAERADAVVRDRLAWRTQDGKELFKIIHNLLRISRAALVTHGLGSRTAVEEGPMDRIDAMRVFVTALDEGSLAGAGRKLGRSPAAVSRAVAFLEGHVGVPLLHRTTRSNRLSEVGERYAAACRRVLDDLNDADTQAAGERSAPRGTLVVAAPVFSGEGIVRPIVDDFLDAFPTVSVRLLLVDRPVNMIDEGIDVALRIEHLPDSSIIAVKVGEARRMVVAAPSYLAKHPRIDGPGDLSPHQIIALSHFGVGSWSFSPANGSSIPRTVQFTPRVVVDSARAAIASAIEGRGVARALSNDVAQHVRAGRLRIIPGFEETIPVPVSLVLPDGRLSVPKVRAFVDFVVPRLRAQFACLAVSADA
jgi:DNA-binding transcriptional LysR family regulator